MKLKKNGNTDSFTIIFIAAFIIILAYLPMKKSSERSLNKIANNIDIKSKTKVEAIVDKNKKITGVKTTVWTIDFFQTDIVDEYESEISYNEVKRKYIDEEIYKKLLDKETITAYIYTITFNEKDYKILSMNEELEKEDYQEIKSLK